MGLGHPMDHGLVESKWGSVRLISLGANVQKSKAYTKIVNTFKPKDVNHD